jgi:hypothetical protein
VFIVPGLGATAVLRPYDPCTYCHFCCGREAMTSKFTAVTRNGLLEPCPKSKRSQRNSRVFSAFVTDITVSCALGPSRVES